MADILWTRDITYNVVLSQFVLYDFIIEVNWIEIMGFAFKSRVKCKLYVLN